MTANRSSLRTPIAALIAAIAIWGIYLAVGATGMFTGIYDPRRSFIVLVTVGLFLSFWIAVVMMHHPTKTAETQPRAVNRASIASMMATIAMYLLWSLLMMIPAHNLRYAVGWLIAGLLLAAWILALIGLSDPRTRRYQSLAIWTMLLQVVAVILYLLQART